MDTDDLTECLGETTNQECKKSLLMHPINLPRDRVRIHLSTEYALFRRADFKEAHVCCKIIKNTKFVCEVFSIKLGAIYCRRTKMKIGLKTLKTAVIRRVAEVFGGMFVLTGIFIKGGVLHTSAESANL